MGAKLPIFAARPAGGDRLQRSRVGRLDPVTRRAQQAPLPGGGEQPFDIGGLHPAQQADHCLVGLARLREWRRLPVLRCSIACASPPPLGPA
jgi:hypothetical protein